MEWPSASSSSSNRLPVFVFPSSIAFYADDNSSLKQILTLYNPYDFTVKFKVLSTAPSKYSVVDPEGSIRSRCYVDIVIRMNDISPRNHNKSDEFRIWMYQSSEVTSSRLSSRFSQGLSGSILSSNQGLTCGHRDVTATLFGTKALKILPNETDFTMTSSMITSCGNLDQHPLPGNRGRRDSSISSPGRGNESPSLFLISLTLTCLTLLLLPNSDTVPDSTSSSWYSSLLPLLPLPSSGVKLCAAYVLGVITKLILM